MARAQRGRKRCVPAAKQIAARIKKKGGRKGGKKGKFIRSKAKSTGGGEKIQSSRGKSSSKKERSLGKKKGVQGRENRAYKVKLQSPLK